MLPSREDLLRRAAEVPGSPVAIEAFWNGDTQGWFVVLTAVFLDEAGRPAEQYIAELSAGGDMRIMNSEVPPWPEAVLASAVGAEVAAARGIPFWFASPDRPEDGCPRFWERERATPCQACGILLLAERRFAGLCFRCSDGRCGAARAPHP